MTAPPDDAAWFLPGAGASEDASGEDHPTADAPPGDSLGEQLEWAMRLDNSGEVDAAERLYRTLADARDPGIVSSATYNLGRLAMDRRDLDRAEALFKEAATADDFSLASSAMNNLGVTLQLKGEFSQAEQHLRAVAEHADHELAAVASHNLGELMQRVGETEKAGRDFRAAVDSATSISPMSAAHLGLLCAEAGGYDAAEDAFYSSSPEAMNEVAQQLIGNAQADRARHILEFVAAHAEGVPAHQAGQLITTIYPHGNIREVLDAFRNASPSIPARPPAEPSARPPAEQSPALARQHAELRAAQARSAREIAEKRAEMAAEADHARRLAKIQTQQMASEHMRKAMLGQAPPYYPRAPIPGLAEPNPDLARLNDARMGGTSWQSYYFNKSAANARRKR